MKLRRTPLRAARRTAAICAAVLAAAQPHSAVAEEADGPVAGVNDFGAAGLMQTPNARMAADGDYTVGVGSVRPYNQIHMRLQFLPWLETVLRYTDVVNALYGQASFSGNQTYKDKSIDFKATLVNESDYLPAIAFGVQDFGGTGLFSSEYFVASRRYYNFDFSAGLGWGRVGAGGHWPNPFGLISSHFSQQRYVPNGNNNTTGASGLSRLFTGESVGPFGGMRWQSPVKGLDLLVEYDGNDYKHEALREEPGKAFPLNLGLDYHPISFVDLTLGYERGNQLSFGVALSTNFEQFLGPTKIADPPPPPIHVRSGALEGESRATPNRDDCRTDAFSDALRRGMARQGFTLFAADCSAADRNETVWVMQTEYRSEPKAVGRIARVMTETAPDWVEQFTVVEMQHGLETGRSTLWRKDFERLADATGSAEEITVHETQSAPQPAAAQRAAIQSPIYPRFSWDAGPQVRQQVGGPNGFYFGQLWAALEGRVDVSPHLDFSGELGFNIVNNFGGLTQTSNSELPHVRTDITQYLRDGEDALVRLDSNYIWSPATDWYARLSGGIFEEMYGGVAAETLYRPTAEPWAVGFDVNWVKKRGFDERFDFKKYTVATGDIDLYYQLPFYNLSTKVSVGRYLAGDWGTTLDIARTFRSGVSTGAFVTFTNVPYSKFGEGDFDKGVFISIPIDLFFVKSSARSAGFVFRPLTRDGGQKVNDGEELYGVVGPSEVHDEKWPDIAR